uniref:SCAN box domain-containing protein n=1 Tax=Pseudonaja textilis TaxID=8673 RepID=A0A670YWN4_PSETE
RETEGAASAAVSFPALLGAPWAQPALPQRGRMEGSGKGPAALQPGSCGESWTRTGQKVLQEGTILPSEVPPWSSIQCWEAEGPRGLCSRLHDLCRRWLRPGKHSKAQMLDLVQVQVAVGQHSFLWLSCSARFSSILEFTRSNF